MTTIKTKFKILIFTFLQVPMGVRGIFRPPVQGGSSELISKFLSSMILYNHSTYRKLRMQRFYLTISDILDVTHFYLPFLY